MISVRQCLGRTCAVAALGVALVAAPATTFSQTPDPKPVTPSLDFSGLIFGNYRYTYDSATKAANGGKAPNKFDIERVYLNFRMPAGDDGSIRVTTDIFNNAATCAGCYAGWTARLKYAYFNYNFLHDIGGNKGFNASVRVGMLHTAMIDHVEQFWLRWISLTAIEKNAFFSSSDVGVAGVLTLPNKWGELYATMTNGSGYSQIETDPYKDYAARLSLTPLGNETSIWKTLTISPYFFVGHSASKFINGGAGQIGPVDDGNTKNRNGIFVGLRDRRLTLGADWDQRTETAELGANTAASPRTTYDNTGTLTSAFAMVRPIELFSDDAKFRSPFGIFARVDNFKPFSDQRSAGPTTGTQTTSSSNQFIILGAFWDVTSKATFSIDWQDQKPQSGSTTPESKILFVHWQIVF